MKKKKGITIYDLAKELNVSASTVSRALQGHHSIGKKTTRSVKKLAKELGYRPNSIAASLRTKSTNTIGIIAPWINRPFISSLISGVEAAAKEEGRNILISQSQDIFNREAENIKALFESRISGLIVSLSMETQVFDHFDIFPDNDIPLVFVDRVPQHWNYHKVIIDNYLAGFKATEHLIQQGCKRISYFGGALHQFIYAERQRGYIDALKKYHIPIDESIVLQGDVLTASEGRLMAQKVLSLSIPPDGIFSSNDTAAVSAIQYAKSVGIRIPDDLAIIGFNNDPICEIIEPSLSTIDHPAFEMGQLALKLTLDRQSIEKPAHFQTITLKTDIVSRSSSLRS